MLVIGETTKPARPGWGGKEPVFSLPLNTHMLWVLKSRGLLVQMWLTGRKRRQEDEWSCSQLIQFCSLAPSSNFCKDWVFPQCFRQTGRAVTQTAKIVNRLPNCFWGLLFFSPLPWGALEPGGCRPGIICVDRNRLPGVETRPQRGHQVSSMGVYSLVHFYPRRGEWIVLFPTKLHSDKTACKQIHFPKSLSFII